MTHELWQPVPVRGLSDLLSGLRDDVLRLNPKRCPKWGFRLAPDLAVQLQPRPTLAEWHSTRPQPLFLGAAAFAVGGVGDDVFRRPQSQFFDGHATPRGWIDARPHGWLQFAVCEGAPDWQLRATGWRGRPRVSRWHSRDDGVVLRDRLVAELPTRLNVFDSALMLRPCCLCCGKALTDPASIARWVGPECAGRGTLTVPGLDRAAKAWAAQAARLGLAEDTPPEIVHDYLLDHQHADSR
jgi:hypothetical protein